MSNGNHIDTACRTVIGVSLNKPHTSGTALHVCVYVCLLAAIHNTINFKSARIKFTKIELVHSASEW